MCFLTLLIALILIVQDLRVYNEEAVLDNRSPEQDYEQYKDKCDVIAKLMGEIQELKASGVKEGVCTSAQLSVYIRPGTCTMKRDYWLTWLTGSKQ